VNWVARFTAQVDGIVVGYGGTVDKHIGDAVMALFGAPRAHEDDSLRAARAALDVHTALAGISDASPHPLRASRVVRGAGRNGREGFRCAGAHLAAGRSVDRHSARSPQRLCRTGGGTREFKGILAATVARRSGQIVYVRGEAGIGKTRLVEEMRRIAEANGFTAHRGLVLDFGVGKGQDAVRALLLSLLGLSPASGSEARQQKVDDLVAANLVPAERLPFLYDLLDLPQTGECRTLYDAMDNAARNRGRRAVAAVVAARVCAERPTFIVVEDLHWADPQLVGHLLAFASAIADGPGLLMMTSRIEGDPIDAAWRASCRGTPFATIDLGPLRRDEDVGRRPLPQHGMA